MRHPEVIIRRRRKTGKQYKVYQLRVPAPSGGMQYKTFRTKGEAVAYAVEQETARKGGVLLDTRMTFDSAVAEFRTAHYVGLRPSATADYDAAFARLRRHFGDALLRAITAAKLEKFRDTELKAIRERLGKIAAIAIERAERRLATALARKEDTAKHERKLTELRERQVAVLRAGTRSVNKAIGALRTLLKFCQSRGYVSQNVATFVKKLKAQTLSDRPMDQAVLLPAEIARMITAADPDWRAALGVLAYGGLRLGELLGVRWGDVELDQRRLLVRQQLCGESGEFREPKTKAGVRFVELPAFVIRELREWKLRCPKGELDLCFPNSDGGSMDQFNFRGRIFCAALRRAKLRRVRVHDLRHGAASLMIAAGCDIASVSRQLGHANVAVTLGTYSHWFQKRTESGLGAMLEAFLEKEDGCEMVVEPISGSVEGIADRTEKAEKQGEKGSGPAWIRTKDQGIMSPLH
jgi:integrase